MNKDYTPFAIDRFNNIKNKLKVDVLEFEDCLLNNIDKIKNKSGSPYSKFTPYFKEASKYKINQPTKNNYKNYDSKSLTSKYAINIKEIYNIYKNIKTYSIGGRLTALKILSSIKSTQSNYNETRNTLSIHTTNLSAYIKFGCVSIREVYWKFKSTLTKNNNDLIKQLYWRDFYYNIGYYHPYVLTGPNKNFNKKYYKVKWITYDIATIEQKKQWIAW